MRSLFLVLLIALCAAPTFSAAADNPAATATPAPLKFGAAVTVKKRVDIASLAKKPEKFAGKTVRLEGVVKEVCQGRGCWVEVAAPNGASFMARSLDESVLLPKDCKGLPIVVEGVVSTMPAESHEAAGEEAKEAHACPKPTYVVATRGIELRAAR